MTRLAVATLFLALTSAHARRSLLDCEDNCGPKTPPYEVIGHHGATEIRQYENATWAISFGKSIFGVDVAAAVATTGVFGYFAGGNNQHLRIEPSVPLITTIAGPPHGPHGPPHGPHGPNGSHPHDHHHPNGTEPEHHPHHNGSHPPHPHPHPHPPPPPHGPLVLVGAFIPLKEDVPKPDNRHVKLVKTNSSKVYVHEFGGFAISWLVKREIDHLRLDLKDLGVKTCKGKFFVATYDGPWKLIGRKNEVWWTEVPRHHHHHNKSHDEPRLPLDLDQALPEPFGFGAMEPEILFPEEMPPPPEELANGPEFDPLSKQQPDFKETMIDGIANDSEGEWVTSTGQAINTVTETL